MNHQNGRKKLNLKPDHKRALMRNQVIHLIENGSLTTTTARVKEVRKLAEKLVTIAKKSSDFNAIRRVTQLLPYKAAAVQKLFKEVAPKYVERPGGYTRIISLGQRTSDTAKISLLEWV